MRFIPLEYEILRGLSSTSRTPSAIQPGHVPCHVVTILPGAAPHDPNALFEIKHRQGYFFEDKGHDWLVQNGAFYYFTRAIASEAQTETPGLPETVDVMVIYKWMEISNSKDGEVDARSTLRTVCHGVRMDVEITRNLSNDSSGPAWLASFSQPSLNAVSLSVAEDLSRAQACLFVLAQKEVVRREALDAGEKSSPADVNSPQG